MSFTITKKLDQLPSYQILRKLAEQNQVCVTGNEQAGSFSRGEIEGDYELAENGLRGTFAGRGVKGRFSCEIGQAAVTIIDKPFWLPEGLLKEKITEGLNKLCDELI